jgi:hypothetical protein
MKHTLTLTLLLLSLSASSQFIALAGAGITGSNFSGELGIGYRVNRVSFTAGYVCPPRQDLPTYFNLRAGYQFGPVLTYAGYIKEHGPRKNRNRIDIGAKVSVCKYRNGDIWVGAGFTGTPYAHAGMSLNLFAQ